MSWRNTFRALRHRNYRLFFAGQIISLVGTWMQNVAVSWLVYRLTQSELVLGITAFCSNIAVFVLGPVGGVAADRYSRYRILLLAQWLSMLQALALALLTLSGKVSVASILALAAVLGVINAFEIPARQSLVVHLASKEDLFSAISLNSAMFNAARVIGPSLAGVLVAAVGEGWCFVLNAVSFLAVIGCLLAIRLPPWEEPPGEHPWERLRGGVDYVRRSKPVRSVLLLMSAATFSLMPVMVLAPVFAEGIFHKGVAGFGALTGAFGVGAVAGTLALARTGGHESLPRLIFLSTSGLAVSLALFAAAPSFSAALLILFALGFCVLRQNASANTYIQTIVPDEFRGRIMAFYSMTVVGMSPFASLAAGALAERVGARFTIACGSALSLSAALSFRYVMKVKG